MRTLCTNCLRSLNACYCKELRPVDTNGHFLFLMHPKEFRRKTGSGRMAALNLLNSDLITGVNFNQSLTLNKFLKNSDYCPMVLYPGLNATEFNWQVEYKERIKSHFKKQINGKMPLYIVIDGTWFLAKKIMRETTLLHQLPRISFKTNRLSQFKIHQQPDPHCLSTIEACHELLKFLNHFNIEQLSSKQLDHYMQAFDWMVQYNLDAANDPARKRYGSGSYREKNRFAPESKWGKSNIFFQNQ